MESAERRRLKTGIAFGLGLLATVLLAVSLSQLDLLPERHFALGGDQVASNDPSFRLSLDLAPLWKLLLGLIVWVLFPISVIYFFISAEARRRVLRDLLLLTLVLGLLYLFTRVFRRFQELAEDISNLAQVGPPPPPEFIAEPSEFIIHPPGALVVGVSALLLASLLVAAYWVWRGWQQTHPHDALTQLASEAQTALKELQAGADLQDVVLRCYYEMSRVLRDHKGVRREKAMTPREFERRLEAVGVRDDHIRRLTRLFEGVRYGAKRAGERERREAQECLAAIVRTYGQENVKSARLS